MSRRYIAADSIVLNRPFCVYVEPGDIDEDGNIEWFAKIAGFELDNMVVGASPQKALVEAIDLLNALTGQCTAMKPEHNFIIRKELQNGMGWECARCGVAAHDNQLEEVNE